MPGGWERLARALQQVDPLNEDGLWHMVTSGTVNIIGGGSGGTSSVDNNPFTPGGTSVTPAGGYQGGRQVASGNVGAFAISPSGLLLVDVRAGGAGGGQANLTVRGTANSDIQVGYASGAGPNVAGGAYVPILGTVNLGAGAAPYASVAVYGSPANPVYNIGTVNVSNAVTVTAAAPSFNVVGSMGVTPLASFTVNLGNIPTVNLGLGTVNVGNLVTITGSVRITAATDFTVWLANSGAGGGFATAAVYGSPAFPVYVQFPSGYFPTVNTAGGGAGGGFASVAVYGSPLFPVYVLGTVNVSNFAAGTGFASAAVYGSPANPVYIIGSANVVGGGGSLGVTQIGSPWGVIGSVGVTPLASFTVNLGSIPTVNLGLGTINVGNPVGIFGSVSVLGTVNVGLAVVDARGSLVATQWIISGAASGQFVVAGSAPAGLRNYISAFHLVGDGTLDMRWASPSGIGISGSMRILPGAGFAMAGALGNSPLVIGSQNSAIYLDARGTLNVGGIAVGWVGA